MSSVKKTSNIFLSALMILGVLACSKKNEPAPQNSEVRSVRLGIQPNEKMADLEAFRQEIATLTGLSFEIVVTGNYEELVDKFKSGAVDFAFFSPVNFIAAEKDAGAKVLLKKIYGKSEFYYGAFIVKASSPIKKISDLKSKKVAFVDPKSTSGHLYPLVMFKQAGLGLNDFESQFAGTPDEAVKAVAEGRADVATVWADEPKKNVGAWTAYEEKNPGTKFRVLAWSEPIPNDAFAVRASFYEEQPNVVFRVMEGLIEMSDQQKGTLKAVFDTDKMTTATSRHYDSVRAVLETQKELQK